MALHDRDKSFTGSIPEFYENHLVPLIFQSYAENLAKRVALLGGKQILELAAGTGVVTRELAKATHPGTTIVATDLNQAMLDRAATLCKDNKILWQQQDALNLNSFEKDSFDTVVCQFSVMFFPSKVRAFSEALRVLKPGGTLLFSVWDKLEENHFAYVVTQALSRHFPKRPPDFLKRIPHGYFDTTVIQNDLANAGFSSSAQIDTVSMTSHAAEASIPAIAYCHGTPLRNEIMEQDSSSLEEATQHATDALIDRFGAVDLKGKIQGHVVSVTV